jgi:hypothetical protein
MVDWDNEATIGIPASEVERISILQRRYNLIEAFETYKKTKFIGVDSNLNIVRARLLSTFIQLRSLIRRKLKDKKDKEDKYDLTYKEMEDICFEGTEEKQIIKAIYLISDLLDEIRLTKIDVIKTYDRENIETENKIKGF